MNASKKADWLIRPQNKLGTVGLIVLLTIGNVIIPFSTDMYTPAIPSLPEYFDTSENMVSLTIFAFFLCMTVGSLLFGTVSDRFGRKPVLIVGFVIYVAGSFACVIAWSIWSLIAFRIVQAFGGGAVISVSMALVKDCFVEEHREQILAFLQVLTVIGPIAAPLFGGIILLFLPWQAIFVVLGILGALCLVLVTQFEETLYPEERRTGGIVNTLKGLVDVGKNPRFMAFLLMVAILGIVFWAYLECASYIYIDFFGLSPQEYAYFFAANAAISSVGPIIWIRVSKYISPRNFTHIVFAVSVLSCVALFLFGSTSAVWFLACLTLFSLATAAIRPYTTNILLAQQEHDTGSASSLINFTYSIFGVLGMGLILLHWPSYIIGLGVIMAGGIAIAAVLWIAILHVDVLKIKQLER